MSVGEARADFPALAHWVHLNSGGMAPMPRLVAAELLRIPQQVAEYGPSLLLAHDESFVRAEAAHATLARFLGAEADEIAFTTQFSTGVSIVVEGLSWRAGDEIVVSDQEHPALLTPILNVARRRGVVVRRFTVADEPAAMLGALAEALTERTRLLAISHVTTETGTRLPVAEMTRLAHERGALALIDGAHTVGQIPLDLRALGCDFYALVGYKWLYGPYPSAALYIRREALDRVEVTWTGSRVTTTAAIDMDRLDFVPGAARFEYGGRVFAHDSALAAAVDYVQGLGLEAIGAHQRRLAGHLHRSLARLPGARIWSPPDPADGTGIVTFSVEGVDGPTLSNALRDRWRIVTRPALKGSAVRVSIAAFTDEADLDLLAEGAATVAAGR
jgi:selenocysteine lyase/cysteine desulfurase